MKTTAPEASTRSHPTIPYQPALDGLRGAAVAAVLLFHGGHLTGGYLGVDAFFVLSGYLITSLLVEELATTGTVSLLGFWGRRLRRLLPALLLVLLAVAAYAAVVAPADQLAAIRGDALATLGYVANWRQVFTGNDYFALFASPSPLQHTWSLAIEEQFYLVWPLVMLALNRRRSARAVARRTLALSLVLAAASFVTMLALADPADNTRVYYGTDTRAASILIGAALAAWVAMRPRWTTSDARPRSRSRRVRPPGCSRCSGSDSTVRRRGSVAAGCSSAPSRPQR